MRKLALLLAAAALVGGAAAVVLDRDPSRPFPSAPELRVHGFAAWPVDTVQEAAAECAHAEGWRLDARSTAMRFASEVLHYPKPQAGESFGDSDDSIRLLIRSDDERGLFLGSALQLERYGRCWYVTEGLPREGDLGATLGFVYRDGRPYLLLGNVPEVPIGFVGYADWETEIEPGSRQIVMPMPELDPGATGHVIYVAPDERGVSETVGARSLGVVPPPPSGRPARRLTTGEVVHNPEVCRIQSGPSKSPERIIRYLYNWTFVDLMRQVNGSPRYERRGFHHLGGDRWRLVVDDAVLIARIPRVADRCYGLVSMRPVGRDAPLRRLWIDDLGVTFGIDWGGGDEATIEFGAGFEGRGGTLKQIREPVTFARAAEPQPADVPMSARVVLYKDGHVASAFYGLFPP